VSIPLTDPKSQYLPLLGEVRNRIEAVLERGQFILGENVRSFEDEAAEYLGATRTVGVANGTDAIVVLLDAFGIGSGDEVICPSFTFYATAEAIARRGATPVFADIDPATLNLDPEDAIARVTPRTKAILAVHLFGRPAQIAALAQGAPVLEDAAQAFGAGTEGARAGSLGQAATFSFYPTKNLFGVGDGGLVSTSDEMLAERVRLLRFHGSRDKERFDAIGYNSRLDELQAAVLRVFLPHVDRWNAARRKAAARYEALGLGELCELPVDEPGHVYHVYCVRTPERDRVVAALRAREIACATYYSTPLHRQPALGPLASGEEDLPVTERAARETVALPLWPGITSDQQEQVVECVRSAFAVRAAS
jgi:dTDP-3-amino-3,4,6-trideoxy-alpha-D-glucose transaminase